MPIAYITSTSEQTSLTLLTGVGVLVWSTEQPVTGWAAADATANLWSASAPESGWQAEEARV